MAFTVSLPQGIRDFEYALYVHLLEKEGVNLVDTPRVVDPTTGKRWVYPWTQRTEAEKFANRLREVSEDGRWQVYDVDRVQPSRGPLGPIQMGVTRRSDGCSYGLRGLSEKLIRRRFPQARMLPGIFIETYSQDDFLTTQCPIWDQVVRILTGLSAEQINELGGYRVYDPVTDNVWREAPPLAS